MDPPSTAPPLTEDDMQRLYQWIDEIPLSRPKRNIGRDFSDGVLAAELTAHFFPKLVELHNYSAANSVSQKTYNWNTLNQKVFKKMGFQVNKADIEGVCACAPGVVERVLRSLQLQIWKIKEQGALPAPKAKPKRSPPVAKSAAAPPQHAAAPREREPRRKEPEQRGLANRQPPQEKSDPYAPPPRKAPASQGMRLPEVQNDPPVDRREPRGYDPHNRAVHAHPEPAPYIPNAGQYNAHIQRDVDTEILVEKEQTIQELRETVDILETKIRKLEQLVKLKDTKIQSLQQKLSNRGDA